MKNIFGKFILIFALVLTSISVCFPNDIDCHDETKVSTSSSEKSDAKSDSSESHHCICSLTCHNLFISFSIQESFESQILGYGSVFNYKLSYYPELSFPLDKPPTV